VGFSTLTALTLTPMLALARIDAYLAQNLPPGFETELTGEAQDFRESFYYLTLTLMLRSFLFTWCWPVSLNLFCIRLQF